MASELGSNRDAYGVVFTNAHWIRFFVDQSTVHRWAIKMVPVLAAIFLRRK